MTKESLIYVADHNGMVGSAIVRKLRNGGFENLLLKSSSELNLIDQQAVNQFFQKEKPEYVFLAAAKVGGINANNTLRAEFLYNNLMIEANVIHAAYLSGVTKLLFLGSTCIYPKFAPQPLKEEYLLTGELEPTNEPYAIAKIAGIKLCEAYRDQYNCNFISLMPTNLYGPNDNYDLNNSHVLPALIRKFHEAKENNSETVEIWGTGTPLREFLHVDDLADACLFTMENYNGNQFLNVGSGQEVSVAALAQMIKEVTGFKGNIIFNTKKPDGTPRKQVDSNRLHNHVWRSEIELNDGIKSTYELYQQSLINS